MPRRNFYFKPGAYFHIFNRSKDKQTIFIDHKDYKRFYLNLLRFEEDFEKQIKIKAYCIMPNHFHLLVYLDPGVEDQSIIPNFMTKLQMAYAKYFNVKYLTPGSIRWWRYKVKHIQDDAYMWTIVNYIQRNSEKHLWVPYEDWKYRSDIKIDGNYEDMMKNLDENELEL